MAVLTIPNTFVAGTPALASEVNANFAEIVNWSTGLDQDNMTTFTGDLAFTIANGNAIVIQNNGNDESIKITQGALLGASKASILITDNQTQTAVGAAELKMVLASGATIPAINIAHGATDTFKLTKDYLRLEVLLKPPVRTTSQRNAISSPEEGSLLYNSTEKNIALYNGTSWVPPVKIDNSSLEYNANEIARIKDSGVTTAKIADLNVTRAKLELLGQQLSNSCGNWNLPLGSWIDVPNLTVTITTTGRPVFVALQSDGSVSAGYITVKDSTMQLRILRDATIVGQYSMGFTGSATVHFPASMSYLDVVTAGTYVYKVQAFMTNAAGLAASFNYIKLLAYEG